jgi:hypothetical protein
MLRRLSHFAKTVRDRGPNLLPTGSYNSKNADPIDARLEYQESFPRGLPAYHRTTYVHGQGSSCRQTAENRQGSLNPPSPCLSVILPQRKLLRILLKKKIQHTHRGKKKKRSDVRRADPRDKA